MKPDRRRLLHEIMDDGHAVRREQTLLAGAQVLRRRRQWRMATRTLPLAALLIAGGIWLRPAPSHPAASQPPAQTKVAPVPSQPQVLTDEQLLAMFPNMPVGLITLADGKKKLIFLHPADEKKFTTRL